RHAERIHDSLETPPRALSMAATSSGVKRTQTVFLSVMADMISRDSVDIKGRGSFDITSRGALFLATAPSRRDASRSLRHATPWVKSSVGAASSRGGCCLPAMRMHSGAAMH